MWDFIFQYRLNIILFVGSLIFLLFIIDNVRKERIKEAYSLIWLTMGIVFLIISLWIRALEYISYLVGIYYSPIVFFLILIIMILFILIQYSIVISNQTEKIKTLIQESALLKKRIEEQENTITNYELRITNYELRIMNYELRITNLESSENKDIETANKRK